MWLLVRATASSPILPRGWRLWKASLSLLSDKVKGNSFEALPLQSGLTPGLEPPATALFRWGLSKGACATKRWHKACPHYVRAAWARECMWWGGGGGWNSP